MAIVVREIFVGKTADVINWMSGGWHISYVVGLAKIKFNGDTVKTSVSLNRLDVITIGKTKMQFLVKAATR